jgi:hypothetical protein
VVPIAPRFLFYSLLTGEISMSMEDILKVLVNSRQQGGSSQGSDPMTDLIGGLLGGGQSQQPS